MTKEVAKAEPLDLDSVGGGMENIVGLTAEDLNIPYVYIVRSNSKHAKLASGETAKSGEFYHSVKKSAKKEMEVMMAFAKRGKAKMTDMATQEEFETDAWRALMVDTDNIQSPFVMTFKRMNYWYGFKDLLSLFMAKGIRNPQTVVLKMTTYEATTQQGFTNYVPKFEIVRETTKEEQDVLRAIVDRFSVGLDSVVGEDEESIEDRYDRKAEEAVEDKSNEEILEDIDGQV